MSAEQFEITIDHAREIVRRVADDDGHAPLVGKENDLLKVLIEARQRHSAALEADMWRREHPKSVVKLRKALQTAFLAMEETDVNLAFYDPELDERYTDPNSQRDLRGMLRRALRQLEEKDPNNVHPYSGELSSLLNRRDPDGKYPRKVRNHPEDISSVGIRAIVEVLFHFWDCETDLPFTDDFEQSITGEGEDGPRVPLGLAAKFVLETAQLIDPEYTAEPCSYAMRKMKR